MRDRTALPGFVLLTVGGGLLIGLLTLPGEWYASLQKPWFNPPDWLFGPVWTLLYVLIAIAGWRCWAVDRHGRAMAIWFAQLALNFLWSPIFFGAKLPSAALVVILLLLVAIAAFIAVVWQKDRSAGLLFVPYALWVAFATLLNLSIVWLN